jgi:hypothetical protein
MASQQAGGFHPVKQACGSRFVDHRVENIPGGFQVLSLAGLRQKGDDRRSHGEVREVAKLLDSGQGIDMCMMAQKEQGLGAHTEFRVPEQSLHFWNGGFIARR